MTSHHPAREGNPTPRVPSIRLSVGVARIRRAVERGRRGVDRLRDRDDDAAAFGDLTVGLRVARHLEGRVRKAADAMSPHPLTANAQARGVTDRIRMRLGLVTDQARSASVGLSRAAFAAGYSPASAPITNPAHGAAISAYNGTTKGSCLVAA